MELISDVQSLDVVVGLTTVALLGGTAKWLSDAYYAGWLPETYKGKKIPPGLPFKPFVGDLNLFMSPKLHEELCKLREKYGDVFKMQFGQHPAFVFNTKKLVKEVFDSLDNNDTVIRMDFRDTRYAFNPGHDILISNSGPWKDNRSKFKQAMTAMNAKQTNTASAMQAMHHMGIEGITSIIDRHTKVEVDRLVDQISNGESFDVATEFIKLTFNVLVKTLIGRLATPEEEAVITKLQTEFPKPSLSEIIYKVPFLELVYGNREKQVKTVVDGINKILDGWLMEDQQLDSNCIVSKLRKMNTDPLSIRGMIMDMFVAGYDSVKYHMTWFLRLIVMYPKVQQRLQYLLVKGKEGEYDKYFKQVYKEVFRYRPIMLSGIWYKNTEDLHLKDSEYIIPANSYLFYNTWWMHHNEAWGKDPDVFRVSRFDEATGVSDEVWRDNFLGFFVGRRSCLGEKMAEREIEIVITEFIRKYTLVYKPEDNSGKPLDDETFVQTIMAQHPFSLRATPAKLVDKCPTIFEADVPASLA